MCNILQMNSRSDESNSGAERVFLVHVVEPFEKWLRIEVTSGFWLRGYHQLVVCCYVGVMLVFGWCVGVGFLFLFLFCFVSVGLGLWLPRNSKKWKSSWVIKIGCLVEAKRNTAICTKKQHSSTLHFLLLSSSIAVSWLHKTLRIDNEERTQSHCTAPCSSSDVAVMHLTRNCLGRKYDILVFVEWNNE